METPDPLETALAAVREGKSRGAVRRALRDLGLDDEERERVYRRARSAVLRSNLPAEFRRAARLHLLIGLGSGVVALGLIGLSLLLVRAMYFSEGEKPLTGDLSIVFVCVSSLGAAGLSVGEILYSFRRRRDAREEESRPPGS